MNLLTVLLLRLIPILILLLLLLLIIIIIGRAFKECRPLPWTVVESSMICQPATTLYVCIFFQFTQHFSKLAVFCPNWTWCMAFLSADFCQAQMSYLSTLAKWKLNLWFPPVNWTRSKIYWVLSWPMLHPSTRFPGNRLGGFCTILLTVIQTDRQTDKLHREHNLPGEGNNNIVIYIMPFSYPG